MIGALLSLKIYGKEPWTRALMFWAVYLVIGLVFGSAVIGFIPTTEATFILAAGIIFSILVFVGLAMFWFKYNRTKALIAWAIAYAIDYALGMIGISVALFTSLLG